MSLRHALIRTQQRPISFMADQAAAARILITIICLGLAGCGGRLPVIEGQIPVRIDGSAEMQAQEIQVQDKRAPEERADAGFSGESEEFWRFGDHRFDLPPTILVGRRLARAFGDAIVSREVLLTQFSARIVKRSRPSALTGFAGNPGAYGALTGVFGPVGLVYGALTDAAFGGSRSQGEPMLECSISTVIAGRPVAAGHAEPYPDAQADAPAALARVIETALDKLVNLVETVGILKHPAAATPVPAS